MMMVIIMRGIHDVVHGILTVSFKSRNDYDPKSCGTYQAKYEY